MLTIHTCTSADAVKAYYKHADYYMDGAEQQGTWGGRAAAMLGLSGQVQWEAFSKLADNLHPQSDKRLTARNNDSRRVAYDFTFSAPKSVSLLYEYTRDEKLLAAFEQSVNDTMQEIETESKTRVRKQGGEHDRKTSNLVWAGFTHFETRPSREDFLPDPQLHHHAVAFNVTWDKSERRFKAAQFGDIKRDAGYYQAAFHARLAHRLTELGYGVERSGKFWEVAGISKELRNRFSRRTAEIEQLASQLNVRDEATKAKLGATSRLHKQADRNHDQLRAYWLGRMTPADMAALDGVQRAAAVPAPPGEDKSAEAVRFALDHSFERSSVVPEKQLAGTALMHGIGSVTPESVGRQLGRAGLITREVEGQKLATTRDVLAEESRMIAFARKGKGIMRPLICYAGSGERSLESRADWLRTEVNTATLSVDQQAAIGHIWHSRDRVILVRGAAGTGKTTMMRAAIAGMESPVVVLAPSARASRGVLREEGFAGADTLASFLQSEERQAQARGGVIWVDEAGLLGTRDMARLFEVAEQQAARVILQGDWKQHGSVSRGAPLRVLQDYAGLRAAELTDIKRQRGVYREAVRLLERGDAEGGLHRLDALGWVHEVPEVERYQRLAEAYLRTIERGETALVVSPTHAEGNMITVAIRDAMKASGRLKCRPRTVATLENLNWTQAQVEDARLHGAEEGVVLGKFAAYREGEIQLAAGDVIRITENGRTRDGRHKLNNGDLRTVRGFDRQGDIVLANGWVLGKEAARHIAHGYVVTSHASQGATVDRVFIGQSSASAPAASREQFYVSASRGRQQAVIFTDDKRALLEAIEREQQRISATELAQGKKLARAARRRKVRARVRQAVASVIDRTRELLHRGTPQRENEYVR